MLVLSGDAPGLFFFPFWESNDLENYNNKTIKLLGDTSEEISFITTYFFFSRALYYIMLSTRFYFSLTGCLARPITFFFFFFDKLHE